MYVLDCMRLFSLSGHNQMGGKIVVVGFFFLTLVLSHIPHVPYLSVIRETFEK